MRLFIAFEELYGSFLYEGKPDVVSFVRPIAMF